MTSIQEIILQKPFGLELKENELISLKGKHENGKDITSLVYALEHFQ